MKCTLCNGTGEVPDDYYELSRKFDGVRCQYCGSTNIIKDYKEGFTTRYGCLDCDTWLNPVRMVGR